MSPLERLRKKKADDGMATFEESPSEDIGDSGVKISNADAIALASISEKLKTFSPAEQANLSALYLRYLAGKTTKWQDEKLVAKGLIEPPKNESHSELPLRAPLSAMAGLLQHHFPNISIELSRQMLSHWRKGKKLPTGAPPPPGADPNGTYAVRKWAEWIAKYILPTHSVDPEKPVEAGKKSLFERAAEAEAKQKLVDLQMAELDKSVAFGDFQSASLFRSNLRHAGTVLNQALTNNVEKILVEKLNAVVAGWQLGQEREMQIKTQIVQASQEAADGIRAAAAKALDDSIGKVQ